MKSSQNSHATNKVALYGGSFDPVHCAHLAVAHAALEALALDKVVFIPAARSPLKTQRASASDADRVSMLRLAIAGRPGFEVDTLELERGGVSYTLDTVHAYQAAHPDSELFWIIGADQYELLARWHRIEDLCACIQFIVLRRPGYELAESPVPGLRYQAVDAPLMPHSSSEIRSLLREGAPTEDLVPATVEAFISAHGLYTG